MVLRTSMLRLIIAFGSATILGCGVAAPTSPATSSSPVVYGADDRKDYYEETDPAWRALMRGAIVSMAAPEDIDESDPNDIQIDSATLGRSQRLCDGQRFFDQPTLSDCSATLIDDDLVLTAGHCARNSTDCRGYRYVFNYRMEAEGQLAPLTSEDLFECQSVVAWRVSTRPMLDFAIVRLDRPATPRFTPAPVRRDVAPLEAGSPLTLISFGSGLPAKIDRGGRVLDPRGGALDYFTGTLDSFGGSSGGGVFNALGEVVGVLVRGERDYVRSGSCFIVNQMSNDGRGGDEESTYVHHAIQTLCARGEVSARLCDATGTTCGDGRCQLPESAITCPADCTLDGGTALVIGLDGGAQLDGGARDGGTTDAGTGGTAGSDAGPPPRPDGPYLPSVPAGHAPTAPASPLSVTTPTGGCSAAGGASAPLPLILFLALAWRMRRPRGRDETSTP